MRSVPKRTRVWDFFPAAELEFIRGYENLAQSEIESCHNLKLLLKFKLVRQVIAMAGWQPHNLKTKFKNRTTDDLFGLLYCSLWCFSNAAGTHKQSRNSDPIILHRAVLFVHFMAKVKYQEPELSFMQHQSYHKLIAERLISYTRRHVYQSQPYPGVELDHMCC